MCLICTCSHPIARCVLGTHCSDESNPRMGDPPGSSRLSSQKQIREGMVSPKQTISCYGGVEIGM
ncbi:unnamed protein product [Malus baccata var. baccata]